MGSMGRWNVDIVLLLCLNSLIIVDVHYNKLVDFGNESHESIPIKCKFLFVERKTLWDSSVKY